MVIGQCLRLRGQRVEALEAYHNALAVYHEEGRRDRAGLVLLNLGQLAMDRKDWDQAIRLFEQGLDFHQSVRDRWGVTRVIGYLGVALFRTGELARAGAKLRQCFEQATLLNIRQLVAVAQMYLGLLSVVQGEPAGLEDLDRGLHLAASLRDLPREILAYQLKAEALQALGRDGRGRRMRRACQPARRTGRYRSLIPMEFLDLRGWYAAASLVVPPLHGWAGLACRRTASLSGRSGLYPHQMPGSQSSTSQSIGSCSLGASSIEPGQK